MSKAWRVVSAVALLCLVIGILGVGVGFFMGSSPSVIQSHGSLTEYISRLQINRDAAVELARTFLARFGLSWF